MDEIVTLESGLQVRLGCLQPEVARFEAVPAWSEKNPVLAEDECPDCDHMAGSMAAIGEQQNNNCTNAALASLLETFLVHLGEEDVPSLSWSYLYAMFNRNQDRGAYCRDLVLQALKGGCAPKSKWADENIYMPRGGFPTDVIESALPYRPLEVYQCENWADARSALARGFAVYHGFVLGQAFFRTKGDGKVPQFDGQLKSGHAMWARGLTRKFGDLRAIVPNSWSPGFGERGLCYIDKSYFWAAQGNYVNLDAYAVRSVRKANPDTPPAA